MKTKIISIIAALSLLSANAAAADITNAGDKAEVMYKLNLIRGVSDYGFDPGLGQPLTREAAVAAVLRVTGYEDSVYKYNGDCTFGDVSEWAKPYVAYGEYIGLCRGIDGTYFGALENVSIRQLCTMYLRMLGYQTSGDIYEKAIETARPLGMCKDTEDREGTRTDLIDISYNSLYVSSYGSTTAMIRRLVDDGFTSLADIAAAGDDGLISAYYSSQPAAAGNTEELKGDLEHAMSYSFEDGTGAGMTVITDAEAAEPDMVKCRKIAVGGSLSFKLDDSYVTEGDRYFTLVVKYYDHGVDRIRIAYNVANMPYCSGYIAKTNTDTWKEARVVIKNARFTHAQEDGADISILAESEGGAGVDEYIAQVMLVKQTAADQPVNPLEAEPIVTTASISFDGLTPSVCLTQMTNGSTSAYNYTQQADMAGQTCVSIGVNKRCVLHLDDDFMDPDENNCRISITYYDGGTNRIRWSYSTESVRYKDQYIQKTGTNTWLTYTVDLTDASFMNRQDGGVDLSIWGVATADSVTGTETEYIAEVRIEKK